MSRFRLKGSAGEFLNRSFPLSDRLLIGGGPDCDIRIPGTAGEAGIAAVSLADERVTLNRLGSEPVFVNGREVREAALASGDEIRVGSCRFILQAPGLRPERVLAGAAVKPRRPRWPWWLAAAVLAGAAGWAWTQGWLALPLG